MLTFSFYTVSPQTFFTYPFHHAKSYSHGIILYTDMWTLFEYLFTYNDKNTLKSNIMFVIFLVIFSQQNRNQNSDVQFHGKY